MYTPVAHIKPEQPSQYMIFNVPPYICLSIYLVSIEIHEN